MKGQNGKPHRSHLERIARRAMLERGLVPDFPPAALAELAAITSAGNGAAHQQDLRHLAWCSIDNDDSRDLDQLTVAESLSQDAVRVRVAIADVDALVKKGSAIDGHARWNTTSVYTEACIFPMLPHKLSTDLTSLNYAVDRSAVVVDMAIAGDGSLQDAEVYRALVQNRAKLAYGPVSAWLEGSAPMPREIGEADGLAENLRLQDRAARSMKQFRHDHGALTLDTVEARMVFDNDVLKALEPDTGDRAKAIIENFMVAANGVTARLLASKGLPSLRRVVRTPKRWGRIRELAAEKGTFLPEKPDSRALELFLAKAQQQDPVRFPDLSLSVIKLLGHGEYEVRHPGGNTNGHFGLAVRDYSHSTAPNRRFPDMITQRLLKAALADATLPYAAPELDQLAKHCTEKEDAAKKVERQVRKSAGAMLLQHRIGERFDGIVTGAAEKGTWVRLLHPPIEGRLATGVAGVDVGQRVHVELVHTDVERGYIDFKALN